MIALTATNQTLEVLTGAAISTDYTASYVDHTTSGGTLGSTDGNISTATTTTIVSAPGSSTQRQIKELTLRNRDAATNQVVTVKKDVAGTEYLMTADIVLQPGESLHYVDGVGWIVLDNSGARRTSAVRQFLLDVLVPPTYSPNTGTTKTITSGSTFAMYLGRAPRSLTTLKLVYRVTTAGATITWAEVAIAKGAPVAGGNPSLTVVGYADVSAVVNSTGIKNTDVSVSSGQVINEGDDLWALIGNSATTATVVRGNTSDDVQPGVQASKAERPSTVVGTASTYTIEAASTVGFFVTAQI